jgi:hypothetical protein
MNLLADISVGGGSGLVHNLLMLLLIGVCVLIVWALGKWLIGATGAPPVALTVWTGLFLIIGAIVIINFLLGLAGHGFISY